MMKLFAFALVAFSAAAQTRPPVVLVNGYQSSCGSGGTSAGTFGQMESLLRAQGLTVYFFDNCTVKSSGGGRPTIEAIGQAFGEFVASLNAPQVDVVAHSMGGLIMRAYLAGMMPSGGFSPPPVTRIRKAVLMATPHYGALALAFLLATDPVDAQLNELLPASAFEWALNTGNQGSFDFRGVDAIAVVGNLAGTSDAPNTSDGAVPVTSASLAGFFPPERTRVIGACHVPNLPTFVCQGPGIAYVTSESHEGYRIVSSFLAGTDDWLSVGKAANQDAVLGRNGGIDIAVADSNGTISKTTHSVVASQGELLGNSSTGVFFGDLLPAGTYSFTIGGAGAGAPAQAAFQAVPGVYVPWVVKNGPRVLAVGSATGALPTLNRAPGMLVAIYGSGLAGASVRAGGAAATILYNSDSQINAVLPDSLSGVTSLTVAAAQGSDTVNLFTATAVPAIFPADGGGSALAFHANGELVNATEPAAPGETITVYATGLGAAPAALPTVTIGGAAALVLSNAKAGPGVDIVVAVVPPSTAPAGASISLSSSGVTSPALTLAVGR
jgi:uncharacterized protein (TIGR03437 family)